MSIISETRWETTPPGVNAEELSWWQEFAEIQDSIAWVQTPEIREIVRSDYISEMLSGIKGEDLVVELGCGTGWLLIELARGGLKNLVGIDFSPKQLEIARRQAADANLADRIEFRLPSENDVQRTADVVICHGFLHHLAKDEIQQVMHDCRDLLRPGGQLIILEPVSGKHSCWWWLLPTHLSLIFSGWGGNRPMVKGEKEARSVLERMLNSPRHSGRGPSPKEMPFQVGEVQELFRQAFALKSVRPVLFFSWTIGGRLILFSMSYPRIGRIVTGPTLRIARLWEKIALRFAPPDLWRGWTFCLFRFTKMGAAE